jgi:hypothetical protein
MTTTDVMRAWRRNVLGLVIRVAHGDYQIQDEGLVEWIRQRDLEE